MSASYLFPSVGILASVRYDIRSGTPLARQVQLRGGSSIPNIVVNAEPIGSIALPTIKTLDLRASVPFTLPGQTKLELYADLFNVLNYNGALSMTVRSGSSYLRPLTISPPRILEFAARFTF